MTAKSDHWARSLGDFIFEYGGELKLEGLSKEGYLDLCAKYPALRLERENNGTIKIMAPVKGLGGYREGEIIGLLRNYVRNNKKGLFFSSATGFDLPDGSNKSPDASWISEKTLNSLDRKKIENEFLPIVPDFIVEIRSKTDSIAQLKKKMSETWIENGVKLAWFIDPYNEKAFIYRANGSIDVVENFDEKLSGEDVLPGFEVELKEFRAW